jgi:two-component system sensor histidine kinase DegS
MAMQKVDATSPLDDFQHTLQEELDRYRKSYEEISIMLEQSQSELIKLTQRNAAITGQLQQVQAQFDTMPRADIKTAYNNALEAQQRLLVMRGQIEKMQGDNEHMKQLVSILERTQHFLGEGIVIGKPSKMGSSGGSTLLEMMINAQEAERQRLSRQMHDGPAQALSNFIVQTEIATRLFELDPSRAKEELNNLKAAAMNTFQKVRTYIFELRPMMLDDLGLIPTARRYVDAFKDQTNVDVHLTVKGQERRLEPFLEVMIFRAIQELMGNSARHNQDNPTKVQLTVQLNVEENLVKVSVADNGKGFDPESISDTGGLGLKLIKERVEMVGGFLEITSEPGQGSKITFQVPCLEVKAEGTS